MRDLFTSEFHRFRLWAAGYALVQIIVLGFMTRVVDLAQQPETVYQVIGGVYGLTGLLLGLYQFGGYRRPNAWLNLLHRPLAHGKVALALLGAGALALAIAVWLPLLLVEGWQATMTARVIDQRHVLLSLSAWLISLCAYLAGAYAMLAHRRHGYSAVLLLSVLVFSHAVGVGALILQGGLLALLLAMVLIAFKPDLSAAPRGFVPAVLTAAPLQLAMWFALVLLGFAVEFVWIAQGSHPNNRAVPLAGGEKAAETAEGDALIVMGLAGSAAQDAPLWREQARISEVHGVAPVLRRVPVRNELTNVAPMEFDDEQHRVRWVFSHDDMRFHGHSLVDGRGAGTLGVEGDHRFTRPPMPGPQGTLVSADTVFQYDSDEQRVLPRMRVPDGEQITGYEPAGDSVLLLSNRALYFHDARDFADGDGILRPRQRAALPGKVGDLQRVDLIELLDGHLASFLFSRASYNAEGTEPFQIVLRIDDSGTSEVVGSRRLKTDYPPLWRFQNWFPAPVIYEVQRAVRRLFSPYRPADDTQRPHIPPQVWWAAGALMLLSAVAAVWRTRQTDLRSSARAIWIITCALLGLPALMSLWLLYPKRDVIEPVALPQPANT